MLTESKPRIHFLRAKEKENNPSLKPGRTFRFTVACRDTKSQKIGCQHTFHITTYLATSSPLLDERASYSKIIRPVVEIF